MFLSQRRPAKCWLYDFATVPEFRGRRLYPGLLRFILSQLKEQGVKRAWIGTEPGNVASQHGIQRAGFTLVVESKFVGRPGQGHFEVYPCEGVPDELTQAAVRTVHGRIVESVVALGALSGAAVFLGSCKHVRETHDRVQAHQVFHLICERRGGAITLQDLERVGRGASDNTRESICVDGYAIANLLELICGQDGRLAAFNKVCQARLTDCTVDLSHFVHGARVLPRR